MSLETGLAISTPDPRGVLARSTIRLPCDGRCNDRPARRKSTLMHLVMSQQRPEHKAIQPQYVTNHGIPFVLLSF
jgi:hypothetical protein